MALVDKYGNFNLAMLMAILWGMSTAQLGLILKFAEFLVKEKGVRQD